MRILKLFFQSVEWGHTSSRETDMGDVSDFDLSVLGSELVNQSSRELWGLSLSLLCGAAKALMGRLSPDEGRDLSPQSRLEQDLAVLV